MMPPLRVVVAPNCHLLGGPEDRLLVADGDGWRSPTDAERIAIVPADLTRDELSGVVLLFVLPGHLRGPFWAMLEQDEACRDFDSLASEVGRFLTFKQLPPPERAVIELVLHGAGGAIEPRGLWAAVNLGDDPVPIELPGLRLRLGAGEGCRLPEAAAVKIIPPEGELPAVLLVVRRQRGQ